MDLLNGQNPIFKTETIPEIQDVFIGINSNIVIHLQCRREDVQTVKSKLPNWIEKNYDVGYTATTVTIQLKK